jgi:hypothetical protein
MQATEWRQGATPKKARRKLSRSWEAIHREQGDLEGALHHHPAHPQGCKRLESDPYDTLAGVFVTVARSWRGLSANLTIKFRNLAKNSAIFLAFRSYVIKSCFGKQKLVLYALFPLNKVVV